MSKSTRVIRSVAAGLVVLGLAGIVACSPEPARERPDAIPVSTTSETDREYLYQKFNRIQEGMTWDEVWLILDKVPPSLSGPAEGTCRWEDSGGVAQVTFENGRVISKLWMGWP